MTRSDRRLTLIHRHTHAAPAGDVAYADDARIVAHLERQFGSIGSVFHELVSERVHVDVHVVPPAVGRPFTVLVTSGLSARPMHLPRGIEPAEELARAELCMMLPPDWRLDHEALGDERWYWPIRLLKGLARLPHDHATWLGYGHSVPNGDPARPFAPGTALCGAVLAPPEGLGQAFFRLPGEPPLHIWQVLPITAAEMNVKLASGADVLLGRLEDALADPYGPIDPGRRSAV